MKKILLFLLLLLVYSNCNAQAPAIQWQKTLGGGLDDWAYCIKPTSDGGFISVGYTQSNNGDVSGNHLAGATDIWVVKTDSSGVPQWKKALGGSQYEQAFSVQQTTDGGYIIAGQTNSTDGDISGNHGGLDAWIVKLNSDGSIGWKKCWGGNGQDFAKSVQQTTDGGYIVSGTTNSTNGDAVGQHGDYDCFMLKLDSDGNTAWQQVLGGSGSDYSFAVIQDSDGGYVMAGFGTATGNGTLAELRNHFGAIGGTEFWIVKLNSSGTLVQQRLVNRNANFDGSPNQINSLQQTADGGYIIAGQSMYFNLGQSYYGNYDNIIVKLNADFSTLWNQRFGGASSDIPNSIQQTSDGGYIVAGYSNSTNGDVTGNHTDNDAWMVRLNSSGTLLWQKSIGGTRDDYANSIIQTTDGGYLMAGYTKSNNGDVSGNHGGYDFWLVKLEADAIPAPTVSTQSLCNGATVDRLVAGGTNLKWYTSLTGGSALSNTTVLITGTYYVSQTIGVVESPRVAVAVTIVTTPPLTSQTYYVNNGFPLSSISGYGSVYLVYATATSSTPYSGATSLPTGTYYGTLTQNGCESTRSVINIVTYTPPTITSPSCGSRLTSIAGAITCRAVPNATRYLFEVTSNGVTSTYYSSTNSFNLTQLTTIPFYNATCSIRVAANFNGQNGDYSAPCSIITPILPSTTRINASQCNTVLARKWSTIYCDPVIGATAYRFEWSNGSTTLTFTTASNNMQLTNYTGWNLNTIYSVRVAIQLGTWQMFGPACNITSPSSFLRLSENEFSPFTVKAIPNPFETEYVLMAQGGNQTPVQVTVYDMLGKQVEQFSVEASDLENRSLGTNYTSGIYNVMISQGDDQQVVRIVKK
ncbi:MAG: hypothetical protein CFE24_11110 [Flavobacterium sp. BFFFF2]|nr:MAG: hypothetical protein CFE24_11110 [Flavobacterium sp. BFFFF2]